MNDVARAKLLLSDGGLWAVSGVRGNTKVWYVLQDYADTAPWRQGGHYYAGEVTCGPFGTRDEALEYLRNTYGYNRVGHG